MLSMSLRLLRYRLSLLLRLGHGESGSAHLLPHVALCLPTPFLLTCYLHSASKKRLTKGSRFIRIEPIKIIRDAGYRNPVNVYL
jgi:hypothetical protein